MLKQNRNNHHNAQIVHRAKCRLSNASKQSVSSATAVFDGNGAGDERRLAYCFIAASLHSTSTHHDQFVNIATPLPTYFYICQQTSELL